MLAKLAFRSNRAAAPELLTCFEDYLAALFWNGQVHRDYLISRHPLAAYVDIPSADALKPRFHSERGILALRCLRVAAGSSPALRFLEVPAQKRTKTWHAADALHLFTNAFDTTSPVGAKRLPYGAPIFSLPVPDGVREDLLRWAESYREHDRIWLSSGTLELPAYKELSVITSNLSMEGRELCKVLERATGKPTFYYVMRYYAYARDEDKRPCPSCGRTWATHRDRQDTSTFWDFDFCCKRCRLVSHLGVSQDGRKYAAIGQYRSRTS